MARRLNDTGAIVSRPLEAGESHSISSRKIENGFLVDQSSFNPQTGEYQCSTVFTKSPPKLTPPKLDGRQGGGAGSSSLADTKKYLSGE